MDLYDDGAFINNVDIIKLNPIKAGPFLGGDQLGGVPCGTPPGIWAMGGQNFQNSNPPIR